MSESKYHIGERVFAMNPDSMEEQSMKVTEVKKRKVLLFLNRNYYNGITDNRGIVMRDLEEGLLRKIPNNV